MELVDKKVAIETVGLNTWAGSRISTLPTVEAIPVEWIEKRIDSYIQFYKEKEKREPALALSISHSINAISELIDDWREENEI